MMKLTCTQMETLREAYLLDTLSERRRQSVAAHLEMCPRCREALEQTRARLAQLDGVEPVVPPAGLAQRTVARVAAEEAIQTTARRFWNGRRLTYAAIPLLVVLLLVPIGRETSEIASSRAIVDTLRQLGFAYKLYTNESPGEVFPPVAEYAGVWIPDLRVLYPKYIDDASLLIDPNAPPHVKAEMKAALEQEPPDFERASRLMAQTYAYHGWITRDAEDVETIRRFRIARGIRDGNIVTEVDTVYRLREGVERFMITDINNPGASALAQSTLPIMVARPQPRDPNAGLPAHLWRRFRESVFGASPSHFVPTLYMDGHVAFVPVDKAPSNIKAMLELLPDEHEPKDGDKQPR